MKMDKHDDDNNDGYYSKVSRAVNIQPYGFG